MKKHIYLILFFCLGMNKLSAQTTEKENGSDNVFIKSIYIIELKKSDIIFIEQDTFFKSLITDKAFSNFFSRYKHNSIVYYSSLINFKIKDQKLVFSKIKNKYEPDFILNQFIVKNLKSSNFKNCKNCMLGSYFYYNAEDYELYVELVEIKNKKYYSIYNNKAKIFNDPVIIKSECKPIANSNKTIAPTK